MLDGLAKIALGWLGWSEEQLYRADLNAIRLAYEGRIEMFQAIFGKAEEEGVDGFKPLKPARDASGKEVAVSPKLFDTFLAPPQKDEQTKPGPRPKPGPPQKPTGRAHGRRR